MRKPQFFFAITLPIVYVAILCIIYTAPGDTIMLRLATDWPIVLLVLSSSTFGSMYSSAQETIGGGYYDPISTVIMIAFYAAIGYLIGLLLAKIRKHRRAVRGGCRECGYDIRYSKMRCPECGFPIREKESESSA